MAANGSISRDEFRARLEEATRLAVVPEEGIFGPRSVAWELLKEAVGFLGGGRAVLLQTAHPWVAHGVDQHSLTKKDPLGRFHRTFENVFTIVYGNLDQVRRVSNSLNRVHGKIVGRIEGEHGAFAAGSWYFANQVDAMMWVHATLWETYMAMRELVMGPIDRETKEAFYQEIKRFALCFGVPMSAQPATWDDFLAYNREAWDSEMLKVGRAGLELRDDIFRLDFFPGSWIPLRFLEIFTAETMPTRLRKEYELPPPTKANKLIYEGVLKSAREVYPRLPARLRYLPAYFEAKDRLAGKPRSGLVTRQMNRLYTGRTELVSAHAWA